MTWNTLSNAPRGSARFRNGLIVNLCVPIMLGRKSLIMRIFAVAIFFAGQTPCGNLAITLAGRTGVTTLMGMAGSAIFFCA